MKTEQVLDAVVSKLTSLTTTGTNITRARIYNHESSALPALVVFMGQDEPTDILSQSLIDWNLTIIIESTVQSTSQVDEILNTIRNEVHTALMADYTLGLSFVKNLLPGTVGEPELEQGSRPIAKQRMEFTVHYRTQYGNLS